MGEMRTMATLLATAVLTMPTLAATSLCVEDAATGFNWENGKWVQSNFFTASYIIRPIAKSETIGRYCREAIAESSDKRQACYARYEVGETPGSSDVTQCTEFPLNGTETNFVRCDKAYAPYNFEPSGEFTLTRINAPRADDYRDSLAIAVGKCSVVAP